MNQIYANNLAKLPIVDANIDLYLANNRLTEAEYTELMDMLHPKTDTEANV